MVAYKRHKEVSGEEVIWKLRKNSNIKAKKGENFMEVIFVNSVKCYREVEENKNWKKNSKP